MQVCILIKLEFCKAINQLRYKIFNNMMHENSWGWGMGYGMWVIPVAIVLIVIFTLRYKRKK